MQFVVPPLVLFLKTAHCLRYLLQVVQDLVELRLVTILAIYEPVVTYKTRMRSFQLVAARTENEAVRCWPFLDGD